MSVKKRCISWSILITVFPPLIFVLIFYSGVHYAERSGNKGWVCAYKLPCCILILSLMKLVTGFLLGNIPLYRKWGLNFLWIQHLALCICFCEVLSVAFSLHIMVSPFNHVFNIQTHKKWKRMLIIIGQHKGKPKCLAKAPFSSNRRTGKRWKMSSWPVWVITYWCWSVWKCWTNASKPICI